MREARSGDSAGTLSGWVFKAALYAGVSSAGDVLKTMMYDSQVGLPQAPGKAQAMGSWVKGGVSSYLL